MSALVKAVQINLAPVCKVMSPGDKVRGSADWNLMAPPRDWQLRLLWYTQGRGTQDVEVIASESSDQAGQHGSMEFCFVLPNGPYSFSGQLISLTWAIEFIAGDQVTQEDFVLSPSGSEILLEEAKTLASEG